MLVIGIHEMTPVAGQPQDQKITGVFAPLKIGQAITVKESGDRYLLSVMDGDVKLPQSHTVIDVGQDFVVVKDFVGLNQTRIPLTSVKAVVTFKGFVK